MFSWDISPQWQLEAAPENASEVEVRFVEEAEGRTRVELEHRNLDRRGPAWTAVRDGVAGEGGWPLYLALRRAAQHRLVDSLTQAPPGRLIRGDAPTHHCVHLLARRGS